MVWAGVICFSRPGSPSIDQHFADQVYEYAFCMSVSVAYAIAESTSKLGIRPTVFFPVFDWQAFFLIVV